MFNFRQVSWACLYLVLLLACSCDKRVKTVYLHSEQVVYEKGTAPVVNNPKMMQVSDSLLVLLGGGDGKIMSLFSYPDLKFIGYFGRQGRGPNEFVDAACFDVDSDSLYVIPTNTKELYSIWRGEIVNLNDDAWKKNIVDSLTPPNLSVIRKGKIIFSVNTDGSRVRIIGDEMNESGYGLPYDVSHINPLFLGSLCAGPVAFSAEDSVIVATSRLGDVLEIIKFPSLDRDVIIGKGGCPEIMKLGDISFVGKIDGYYDVHVVNGKIYALYSGAAREKAIKAMREGKTLPDGGQRIKVYSLDGKLLMQYVLDVPICNFYFDSGSNTILGLSNNSENLFFVFKLDS